MDGLQTTLQGLLPTADFTRRDFVMTSLTTGFALSVQPVMAQTVITTDANGLEAGEVQIPVAGGNLPAYRAMPNVGGPFPVILVNAEIFGVHEHIKDVCRRLGKLGYAIWLSRRTCSRGSATSARLSTGRRQCVM